MASAKKKGFAKRKASRRPSRELRATKAVSKRNLKAKRGPAIPITARDQRAGKWFEKLVALQARLRGPGGCPWDREQTHQSLRKFLIEETYEVLDAMESSDAKHFSSELGDLLLQVIFHSILAEETGAFTISDVIESVHTKMVRRHPHVFGNVKAKNSKEVLKNWEQIKAQERAEKASDAPTAVGSETSEPSAGPESILGDVPKSLPAALETYQLTRRAARVGFDWEDLRGIFEKIDEEKSEIVDSLDHLAKRAAEQKLETDPNTKPAPPDLAHLEEEVGDLLFAAVNVARFVGTDPEIALKHANRKFLRRFQWMENAAHAEGRKFADLPRERMEALWDLSKQRENSKAAAKP
ncbi:MAG: nucleoside triphosphate pyrophosphohydrolase [Candidatus Acidiferrales bacterium]